jgi:hypothetical protein
VTLAMIAIGGIIAALFGAGRGITSDHLGV